MLLVLISLATTPKLLLHNLLANHKDYVYHSDKDGRANLAKAVINCHTQDLVVVAPYIDHSIAELTAPVLVFQLPSVETVHSLFSQAVFYFELRGPPASA